MSQDELYRAVLAVRLAMAECRANGKTLDRLLPIAKGYARGTKANLNHLIAVVEALRALATK